MWADVAFIVFCATVVVAGMALSDRRRPPARREPFTDTPELTPIDRPILNPANRPLVVVLYGLASELSRTPDALRDMARTIQLHEERAVDEVTRERLARVLDEHAGVVKRGAQEVREAKEST